jgi:threonyl-tRNA synthetase
MASFVLVAFKNTIDYANNIQSQLSEFGFEACVDTDYDKTIEDRYNNNKNKNKIIITLNTKNVFDNTIDLRFNAKDEPHTSTLENMINMFIV